MLTAMSFAISNPKCGLFLDPGLGKTSISLSVMKILLGTGDLKGVLVVAPLRVIYDTWPRQIKEWSNFNRLSHTILHAAGKISLWGEKKDLYLINPEGIKWLHDELLSALKKGRKCPFDSLWIDESTIVRSQDSVTFELIRNMLPLFKRRCLMTGTPTPKNLLDLWGQMYIIDEGETLGNNFYRYREKFFYSDDKDQYRWLIKEGVEAEIYNLVSSKLLSMRTEDYLDMPKLLFNVIPVNLPSSVINIYKAMERDLFANLSHSGGISEFDFEMDLYEDSVSSSSSGINFMKCHQIANGRIYEDIPEDLPDEDIREFKKNRRIFHIHDSKQKVLKELVQELNGKPLLVAYHYKHDLDAIRDAVGWEVPYIGAGVSPEETSRLIEKWNAGGIPVLAGHPASMGHGLNMQESSTDIFWYSVVPNMELFIQMNKRLHRPGVKGSVRVHIPCSMETVDEDILYRLKVRQEGQLRFRKAIEEYQSKIRG